MKRTPWLWLPVRLGVVAVVAGFGTILGVSYLAGGLAFAELQIPYVVVGAGLGFGLVVFGSAVATAQLRRLDRAGLEDALARLLVAAAHLADARARRRVAQTLPEGGSDPEGTTFK